MIGRPTTNKSGEFEYQHGWIVGPRPQVTFQLLLVHTGAVDIWTNGIARRVTGPSVALMLPGPTVKLEFAAKTRTHHAWVYLLPNEMPADLARRLAGMPWTIPLSDEMAALLMRLLAAGTSSLPTAAMIRDAMAVQMFWTYAGEAELFGSATIAPEPHRRLIERAQAYIEVSLDEPISLGELADELATSPTNLIRLFRSYLGTTPIAYVWTVRAARGADLLAQTGLPVAQIAEQCGFKTTYHFSRRLKELTGLSPTELRRAAWGGAT